MNTSGSWFGAKCLFYHRSISIAVDENSPAYEERVVLIKARDVDWAIKKAEKEARDYAQKSGDCEYLGYVNCFEIFDDNIVEFSEIYSLMRTSPLDSDTYINRFYDSGGECTTDITGDEGIDAELSAVGPYAPKIVDYLEQSPHYYKDMTPGKKVLVNAVFWSNGKDESLKLAACLGIGLLDFDNHAVNPEKINTFMLNRVFGEEETRRFIALRDHGFQFYFTPYIDNPNLLEDV